MSRFYVSIFRGGVGCWGRQQVRFCGGIYWYEPPETNKNFMTTKTSTDVGLDAETDEDLLIYMSMRKDDPVTAKSAWEVFYQRHHVFLYSQCRYVLYTHLHRRYDAAEIDDMAKGLAVDVSIKVFDSARMFNLKGSREPNQMRRQVRAWIGTIARNAVRDWLRSSQHESGVHTVTDVDAPSMDNSEDPPDPVLDCIRRLINSLPDKERMVVLAYMQCYDPKKGGGRLPNEESRQLAEALGLTTASLRQIKGRVLRRLKTEIALRCLGKTPE